jgi:hypothetical protein
MKLSELSQRKFKIMVIKMFTEVIRAINEKVRISTE